MTTSFLVLGKTAELLLRLKLHSQHSRDLPFWSVQKDPLQNGGTSSHPRAALIKPTQVHFMCLRSSKTEGWSDLTEWKSPQVPLHLPKRSCTPAVLFTLAFFEFGPETEDPAREVSELWLSLFQSSCDMHLYFYSFLSRTSQPLLSHNPS